MLDAVPCAEVLVGDLEDLETRAKAGAAELLITHSHGRQAAQRLGVPLSRVGIPMFDRLGAAHMLMVGYRGTRELINGWANTFLADEHQNTPQDWPLQEESLRAASGESSAACGSGGCASAAVPIDVLPDAVGV